MAKKAEIVPAGFDNPALSPANLANTLEILETNLGADAAIGISDLDRIKVPNGAKSFLVPSLEGEQTESEIRGIVLLARTNRAFWPSNTISDEPPACYSDDGITGIGEPGGACATCPLAQFGSAKAYVEGSNSDQGQACKQSVVIFLLTEDGFLPKMLRLPPTSIKMWRQYLVSLTGRMLKVTDVITTFDVEVVKNAAGQPYSSINPHFGGRLDPETAANVAKLAEAMLPRLRTIRVAPESLNEDTLDVDAA